MLTNKEVKIVFRRIIREWFNDMDTGYGDFRRALLHDNIEEMNYYMNTVSYTHLLIQIIILAIIFRKQI